MRINASIMCFDKFLNEKTPADSKLHILERNYQFEIFVYYNCLQWKHIHIMSFSKHFTF